MMMALINTEKQGERTMAELGATIKALIEFGYISFMGWALTFAIIAAFFVYYQSRSDDD